ncbi:unnamed protein product [Clonostachys byssicola]|uniref:Uncharacterized protein n=1 Tax=Clonostachys byssicola TaxID=160290 RepID=A0A9N9U1X2_9HYPO|nr:unnamed protein product [Clonostachys byssicola]
MFSDGQATPRDLIPPWGNTLVYLMLQGQAMNERMLPLASLLLESGSDLSYRDEDGYSSCMLIFQSKMGLDYLQDHVCHFWDLETFSNFDNGDLWLISSIARCTPRLLRKLELQNKELRTPMEISSSIRPRIENIVELTAEQQVAWVIAAAAKDRVPFMQTLCSCGTLAMAKPFIDSSLDLDEIVGDSWGMTYLRSAAKAGNLEVVKALIEAGAKMDQKALYWLSDHLCTSVLDEFLWRWRYISLGKPVLGRGTPSIKSELWITDTILSHPDFTGPNALLLSIWPGVDRDIVLSIMKHGIGRRDGQPPVTRLMKVWGSEVIQATKTRLPYLKDMLHYGLGVDCEDAMGCTAVLFAIDLAAEKELALLINAGANLTRRTRYGLTPLELAKSNLEADHPRPEQRAFNSIWFQARKMTLEQDQRIYHMLSKAIHVQRRLPLCEPTIVVPRDVHIQ